MSEMVDRVARAIVGFLDSVDGGGTPWDEATEEMREEMRKMARAVIEEMREPTSIMIAYAIGASEKNKCWGDVDDLRWRAMIDAALK